MSKFTNKALKISFKKIFGIDFNLIRDIFFYSFRDDFPYLRRPIEFGRSILGILKLIKIERGLELKFRLKYARFYQ